MKLRGQKIKIIRDIYRLLYINLTVTTNQKSIIDTQTKKKRKEFKHSYQEFLSGLAIKDVTLSLLWCNWPGNFCMLKVQPNKTKQNKKTLNKNSQQRTKKNKKLQKKKTLAKTTPIFMWSTKDTFQS